MNPEIPNNIKNPELKREGIINLDALSFIFCEDDFVRDFYDKKIHELGDKEKWIEENKEKLEQNKENKEEIAKAVEDGLIADSQPETIWQFKVDKAREDQEKVLAIKSKLKSRVDEMKSEAAEKLSKFLPDWSSYQAKVVFTINEEDDYCTRDNTITADLSHLLSEKNPIEDVIKGLTHEVFHLWMFEKTKWSDAKQDEISDQALRERIIFKTVNEGLAVLIDGQSLEEHHQKQGKNYPEYTKESFRSFNDFLTEKDRKVLEKKEHEEFQNMGHFYVVGNEIAKVILQHDGVEAFKKLIINARENPAIFLQRYNEIYSEDMKLPKINL